MELITITGNVGKDPTLRQANGDDVLSFGVATYQGKDKPARWFDVSIWGTRAKALSGLIAKGAKVTASGRFGTREHEGKTYFTVNASEIDIHGRPERSDDAPAPRRDDPARQAPLLRDDLNDDLPF